MSSHTQCCHLRFKKKNKKSLSVFKHKPHHHKHQFHSTDLCSCLHRCGNKNVLLNILKRCPNVIYPECVSGLLWFDEDNKSLYLITN